MEHSALRDGARRCQLTQAACSWVGNLADVAVQLDGSVERGAQQLYYYYHTSMVLDKLQVVSNWLGH